MLIDKSILNGIPKILNSYTEKIVFGLLLLLSLFYIWQFPAFVSIDGPSHLYNASLLNFYHNSKFLQQYLGHNSFFLPNYMSHWLLRLLLKCFDSLNAEKMLISLIVVFLTISFRMLIKTITKEQPYYSFLIFPIVFNSLLHYGFYNFSLGFIFFNLHFYLAIKITEEKKMLYWILLFLNSLMMYYCHIFGYAIAMLVCSLYMLIKYWIDKKELIKNTLSFIAVHVPTLIFALLFFNKIHVPSADYDYKPHEKIDLLLKFSPGIAFNFPQESFYSSLIPLLLVILIASSLIWRFKRRKELVVTDFFLFFSALLICFIFVTKNGDMGGMLTHRLVCLLFYFLIVWAACNALRNYITLLAMLVIMYVFCGLLYCRTQTESTVQSRIIETEMAQKYIHDKSIIQVCSYSDMWLPGHIASYIGINKEVILLDNYESYLEWFPLSWTDKGKKLIEDENNNKTILSDYIFVYGCSEKEQEQKLSGSTKIRIHTKMLKLYESSDKYFRLYGLKP